MKTIQCELKSYNRKLDNSVSLRMDSLMEMSSKDIGEIDSKRGDVAIVILTDSTIGNEVDVDIEEILKSLPENDTVKYKSPSARFRGVLWKLLEEKLGTSPSKEEFADYYKREYDKIIDHYKDKFEEK